MAKTTTEAPAKALAKKKSKSDIAPPKAVDVIAPKAKAARADKGKEKAVPTPTPITAAPAEEAPKKIKKARKADAEPEADAVVEKSAEGKKETKRKAVEGAASEDKKGKKPKDQSKGEVESSKVKDSKRAKAAASAGKGEVDNGEAEERQEKEGKKQAKKEKKAASVTEPEPTPSDPPQAKSKGTKSSKTAKAPPPPPDSDEEAEPAEDNDDDASVQMFDFSTDDDDSSDEEVMDEDDAPGIDVKKLPTIAKDDAVVKQKLEKAKRKPTADRGVIYLGRVPHGFYEDQMRSYFNQFGDVTRLRLSRNKRTGKSKHYAFIEFDSSSVAQIVAETMDNYLLMGHILTCKVIPKEKVHPELWVGANRKWRKIPTDRLARLEHNKPRTEQEQHKAEKRLLKRQAQKKRKLAEAGIDYDFEAISYKKKSKPAEA